MQSLLSRLPEHRPPRDTEDGIWLAPISHSRDRRRTRGLLNMSLDAYLTIVDTAGRAVQAGKRGFISAELRPILERLGVDEARLLRSLADTAELFGSAMGSLASLAAEASRRGRRWIVGALDVYDVST